MKTLWNDGLLCNFLFYDWWEFFYLFYWNGIFKFIFSVVILYFLRLHFLFWWTMSWRIILLTCNWRCKIGLFIVMIKVKVIHVFNFKLLHSVCFYYHYRLQWIFLINISHLVGNTVINMQVDGITSNIKYKFVVCGRKKI